MADNVDGTRVVLEEALRAGVERVVYTSSVAASARRRAARRPTSAPFARRARIPYVDAKREAEVQALRIAALGLPVVIVCPAHVLRARRPQPLLDRARAALPARADPGLRRRRDEHRRRRGRGARAAARRRARRAGRALHPRQPQLHAGPPVRRPRAAVRRRAAGGQAAEDGGAGAGARRWRRCRAPRRSRPTEVRASRMWWAFRSTKARRELGWKPSHHEDTLEATIAWYREREPQRLRAPGARQPFALRVAGGGSPGRRRSRRAGRP